ncbi:hypothetical protein Ahy_A09g044631 [Arachis hypogaea]|uniref:Uncharacterized protein n=1 Tax=Arachis hypogaea TaxID=3818 RepID=A0A445BKF3_ARAHY|nr:hypothetical protein Ahy_A09g044631 [Arachis hypogaea]
MFRTTQLQVDFEARSCCNATVKHRPDFRIRLIVNKLDNNVIGATVMTGRNIGDKVYIPEMNLIPSDS